MSQSPLKPAKSQRYVDALRTMERLIRRGQSFSGSERNCAFLNTGGGRFATVSAVSGLDFPDDARAVGVTDWDSDGAPDLWISNRSSPRVRLLRNDTPHRGRFVALRLRGVRCNRDAIGARVELEIESEGRSRRLIRSVRAGDAYLSQSSKWVHFGLGRNDPKVTRVVVRWPGGSAETIEGVLPDGFYDVVQGEGRAHRWHPPAAESRMQAAPLEPPAPVRAGRVLLSSRYPVPHLRYQDWNGAQVRVTGDEPRPTLLNLWGSTCKACLEELGEFQARAKDLEAAGLRIVAVSIDTIQAANPMEPAAVRKFVTEAGWTFATGLATVPLLDRLEMLHGQIFFSNRPLPLPTSFLLDANGRWSVLYRGRVTVDQLLADVKLLQASPQEVRALTAPFPGRWFREPDPLDLRDLGERFMDEGYVDDALHMFEDYLSAYPGDAEGWLDYGLALDRLDRPDRAVAAYRRALQHDPTSAMAYNNLGYSLTRLRRLEESIPLYQKAIDLDPNLDLAQNNLGKALVDLRRYQQALEHYRWMLERDPTFADLHNNVGVVLLEMSRIDEARAAFAKALSLVPDHPLAHTGMGRLLAAEGRIEEAMAHLSQALRAGPDNPYVREQHARIQALLKK